ncbi:electron transporter [Sphingomonas sp. Leaf339]|uniref:SCO family protein n=1 Tax=Sphingomonas sp. Leaf339 TaxID=1736343 RepID=UPI0006FEA47B|nr:SCO family protein [Sphingomonas sp. Leaf339]KQU52991.1 electron transporter [Sphingomonas sp. Leaf339]
MNRCWISLPLALVACHPATPADDAAAPLAGARIGGPFALVDQNGKPTTDRSFAGQYRVMYFGYTFCPDVCPTDVQTIAQAMKLLEKRDPALAARVVPIFVTVDPARDTPAVLKQFVSAFHPRLVGLTGDQAAIDAIKKAYGVYSAKGDASAGGGYLVNHSRQAYLMDPANRPLALLPQEQGAEAVAAEIGKWAR